jgi:hypothetical protein
MSGVVELARGVWKRASGREQVEEDKRSSICWERHHLPLLKTSRWGFTGTDGK